MTDDLEYVDTYFLIEKLQASEWGDDDEIRKLILCLAREIESLKIYKDHVHKLIPQKYKKSFPKSGENPFFSTDDLKPTEKDFTEARARMAEYFNKAKQQTSEESQSSF